MRTPLALVGGLALSLLGGCTSPWYSARFVPAPLEVELSADGEPPAQARALLTVVGIRREADGEPAAVVVRLRLDNMGSSPLALVEEGFDCVTGDLISLAQVRLDPAPGEPLGRDESRTWTATFPMPAGRRVEDLDWRGLNLKWTVDFDGRRVGTGVTFDRAFGYDPYWDSGYPHTQLSVGVGVSSF